MMLIVCGPCGKRTQTVSCTWATDSSRASLIPTDYIKRLEDRIKLLEERNRQSHQNQPTNNPSSNETSEDPVAQTTSNNEATTLTYPPLPHGSWAFHGETILQRTRRGQVLICGHRIQLPLVA